MVHITNGRGGDFAGDVESMSWPGSAFAPNLHGPIGIITLMTFDDSACHIRTIEIDSFSNERSVVDEWTWVRKDQTTGAEAGPVALANPYPLTVYPNPLRGTVAITGAGIKDINVFDAGGRKVRTLKGMNRVRWDGRDGKGRVVPSGIYVCRFENGSATLSQRICYLK